MDPVSARAHRPRDAALVAQGGGHLPTLAVELDFARWHWACPVHLMPRHPRQIVSLLLVLAIGATSCVTTDVSRGSDPRLSASELRVWVCRSASVAHSHRALETPVHTRLLRLDHGPTVIGESRESIWSVSALPPGRYRLEVLGWQRPDGRVVRFRSPRSETFTVRAAEHVDVHVVLSDKRGWFYAVLAQLLAGVGVGILVRHTK